ncbi:MAG: hypothetical protein A3G87_01515 [Omnitrophica bacterium RIFCSPLOWO2_12_FULL_50_11]|nr:MAG: hypothetical protein A3G87_01515 [Omnitrophica bacterium RIFCSPLOWO2_12_FULL_50_11]
MNEKEIHELYLIVCYGSKIIRNDPENREVIMKKRMSLQDKAEAALKEAVRQVVERHKKTGRPLAVWQNGKTVRISPHSVK